MCGYQTDLEVAGGDDAVLVGVHDAKGLLELLDLLLGEVLEDVDLLLGLPAGKRKMSELERYIVEAFSTCESKRTKTKCKQSRHLSFTCTQATI